MGLMDPLGKIYPDVYLEKEMSLIFVLGLSEACRISSGLPNRYLHDRKSKNPNISRPTLFPGILFLVMRGRGESI